MQPGKYLAFATDWGILTKENQEPRCFVEFTTETGDKVKWFSTLDETKTFPKSGDRIIDLTLRVLTVCGLSMEKYDFFAQGKDGGSLDSLKQVAIEVGSTVGKDGNTYQNVKSVRDPSDKPAIASKLDQAGSIQTMGGLNLKGNLMRVQQEMGITNESRPNTGAGEAQKIEAGDIPF